MSGFRQHPFVHTFLVSILLFSWPLLAFSGSANSDSAAVEAMVEKLRAGSSLAEPGSDPSVVSKVLFEIIGSTQDESLRAKAIDALEEILPELEKKEEFSEALCQAVWKGDTPLVKTLLDGPYNANVRRPGLHWSTPLHQAIQGGHNEIVDILLAHGADPNAVDYSGFRPLYRAIEEENVGVINALLDKGVSANGFTRQLSWGEEDLPLTLACRMKSVKVINLLLGRGADPNADPGTGYTPLLIATHDPEIAARLIEAGADVAKPSKYTGQTPLHSAANGLLNPDLALAVTRMLLQHGADPNSIDFAGRSALHAAVIGKSTAITGLLIDAGADVNHVDNFGFTAYGYAAAIENDDAMALLKEKGARTEGVGFNDDEPFHRAVLRGDLKSVKKLLDGGADANKLSANQWTPLHAAAMCVYMLDPDITAILLKHGADPNATGPHGWTPLHLACFFDNYRMLKDLLGAGANPALINDEKKTPRDLAVSSGAFSAVKVIDRHIANSG